ncbi:hypothetical protein Q5752_003259 [Cryptotrichosporon argae]
MGSVVQALFNRVTAGGKWTDERKLVLKLDVSLMIFSILGLTLRYVDQQNISTAFTSGMKEDLNMYGNQYNTVAACWSVGYVIGQIPGNILLNRVPPHRCVTACQLLPDASMIFCLEIGWTIMTLCTTWVKNWHQLCFIRFMVGLFESAYYPGLLFIIGSWYTKRELGKRSNFFQAATALGTLVAGVMQAGIYKTLNGVDGRAGWRWMFIIDAVISLPVAVAAYFFIPDLPFTTKRSWILSADDLALARSRLTDAGRLGPAAGGLSRKALKKVVLTWHIWLFTLVYSCYIFAQSELGRYLEQSAPLSPDPQQSMAYWLKDSTDPTYTVEQINYYPCGIWATQIVSALSFAFISDRFLGGRRWPPLILVALWHCMDCAVLAGLPVYQANRATRWVLYYLSGVVNCTPGLLYAWCSEILGHSSEKRGIVMGTFNAVSFAFNAWLPLLLFKQVEQPKVYKGNIAASVASAIQVVGLLSILYLSTRDAKRGSSVAESVPSDTASDKETGHASGGDEKIA